MITNYSGKREEARILDQHDPLRKFRQAFHIPKIQGRESIYLCGNSLGLQPKLAREYVLQELDDWAALGVEGHFHAKHPWMPYHEFLTDMMAKVVGAKPAEVVVMNSLTVNLHLLMASFYRPTKSRFKILVEADAFPSDRYAVASQAAFHGFDPNEAIVTWQPREGEYTLRLEDYKEIMWEQGGEIALVMIGGVNYYTGQYFPLKEITEVAHEYGAVVGFDLAHGAGNIQPALHDSGADFAAWCTYKYLNSGPGGISGIFVHEKHAQSFDLPRFAGWWGHNKETRFQMRDDFDPLPGAEGWQLSNPPILPLATLRASLELFQEAGMAALREKSIQLTNYLEFLVRQKDLDHIELITPAKSQHRGAQLSLFAHEDGRAIFDYLTENGVIADWREPNVIRIAPVPMYNGFEDVWKFVDLLSDQES